MAKSWWTMTDVNNTGRLETPRQPFPDTPIFPRKQLPKLCKNYKSYKGIMPPKCAGGEGCQVCWLIYEVKNDIGN